MENRSPFSVYLPLLFAFILVVGMFIGYKMSNSIYKQTHETNDNHQLDELINLIENKYADSIDRRKLVSNGIEGILKELDPHTVYIPKEELSSANEELEGSFLGIGVEFFVLRDTVYISYVMPNGPSSFTNLHFGDRIISIDNEIIAGKKLSNEEIISRIKGPAQSEVRMQVIHLDKKQENIVIKRGEIPFKSLVAAYMINKDIAYIKLRLFSETTYDEFSESLKLLKQKGATKLIIDVRDNPGGYMDAVARIADELIAGKNLLIKTKGNHEEESYYSEHEGIFEKGDVSILVNENSASASEILAGCIQDLDRGIVVGRRTFGKGLVQEQFDLPDHAAIRITTARYYLPSGRCIQKSFSSGKADYEHDIYKRYKKGELIEKDSISNLDDKPFYTKKKRIVYEGEGIRPDLFVGIDTTMNSELNEILNQYIIEEFAQAYYYKHAADFTGCKNLEEISVEKLVNNKINLEFESFCKARNCKISSTGKNYRQVDLLLAAEFAKIKFGTNGRIKILNNEDELMLKTINLMKKN